MSAPRGGSAPGGVCSRGGCLLWGVSAQWGVCSRVGCLLWGGGCLLWGVSVPGGCLLHGGVCSMGVSAPWGCLLWGGCLLQGGGMTACTEADTPPVNRMTNRCKNITLATTSLQPVIKRNQMKITHESVKKYEIKSNQTIF